MPKTKAVSPARSQGGITTPKRKTTRGSRSLCSPALSTASGRLTSLIDQFKDKNMDSFALSPLNGRSVLNDNTEIEEPRRKSWWKKLDENSQDVMEVLEDNKLTENNPIEEFIDIDVLSQEKKNYTLDLPESSDNESIHSIVLPQRRLFTQKENLPQQKYGHLMDNRESLAKLHKTNNTHIDKTVNVGTRELFQNTKRSKPIFPAALLNISPDKTAADKSKGNELADPKPKVRNIFGNRPANKRKNMFADFIVSESEDEIPDIQPKVFGFQKKVEQRRISSVSRGRESSPASSITTDIEMDFRMMLPSSTMVENQLEDMVASTPVKRARLSKLSEAKESEAGTLQTNTTSDKTKQSNKSASSNNKSKASSDIKDKSFNSSRTTRSMLKNSSKHEENVNISLKKDAKGDKSKSKITSRLNELDVSPSKSNTNKQSDTHNKTQDKSKTRNSLNAMETQIEEENCVANAATAINNATRIINKSRNKSLSNITNKSIPNTTNKSLPNTTNKSVTEKERTVTIKIHDKVDTTLTNDNEQDEEEDDENNFTLEYEHDDEVLDKAEVPSDNHNDNTKKHNTIVLEKDNQQVEINKSKSNKSSLVNKTTQKPTKTVEESVESQTEQYSADDNVDGNQEPETDAAVQDQENKDEEMVDQEMDNEANNSREDMHNEMEQENEDEVNVSRENEEEANESEEDHDEINNSRVANESQEVEDEDQANESQEIENKENENDEEEDQANESQEVENKENENEEDENQANESQEVEAEVNESQKIEEDEPNENQEVENEDEDNESETEDDVANEKQEVENESEKEEDEANESLEEANESNEAENEEENESEADNDEGNQSQEVEHEVNESQEIANESQEVENENEDQANESQDVENKENESEEDEDQANESQEIEAEVNESHEIEEDEANESQEIEEEANESQINEDDEAPDQNEQMDEEEEAANDSQVNDASVNESQEVENEEEENNEAQSDTEVNESEEIEDEQQMEDSDEADKAIATDAEMSDQDDNQTDEMEVDNDEEESDNEESEQNEQVSHEEREIEEQNEIEPSEEIVEESPNVTHDTTGRHRKKNLNKSPEVILHDKTNQMDSFTAQGCNTSVRKTKSMIKNLNIRPSLAPPRDSIGFSDGTTNSSAEGSGWDSHRTTRKTLRQTFGKDFTPRKSLRALVMEKSAKRQTEHIEMHSETVKFPLANSTEMPEDSNHDVEDVVEPDHELSRRTRQTTLEQYLQKIKEQNIEKKFKMEAAIRNSLKAPVTNSLSLFKVPGKPAPRRPKPSQIKPKKQIKSVIPLDELPPEVIEDMKYKPPKRFQPSNASWITKRLYKFLETKLEPKYDYKARVRAEKLVETIYSFAKDLRRHHVAPADAVDVLKHELARLDVVRTHFDFYEFFHEFMPREVRIKVVPDIVNKIALPRHGVFSDILRGNTVHG